MLPSAMPFPCRLLLYLLLILPASSAFAQDERPAFLTLMESAKVKKVITVDTVAGHTKVLLTSIADNPAFVFIFAPGGR